MCNAELKIFDGNNWYWVYFRDGHHSEVGRCVAIEIENTDLCKEDCKVPDETLLIIGEKEAKYLLSFLNTFFDDNT